MRRQDQSIVLGAGISAACPKLQIEQRTSRMSGVLAALPGGGVRESSSLSGKGDASTNTPNGTLFIRWSGTFRF